MVPVNEPFFWIVLVDRAVQKVSASRSKPINLFKSSPAGASNPF